MTAVLKTDGQIAYEAYAEHAGGKSIHGEDLPSWGDQKPGITAHWEAAAGAVRALIERAYEEGALP